MSVDHYSHWQARLRARVLDDELKEDVLLVFLGRRTASIDWAGGSTMGTSLRTLHIAVMLSVFIRVCLWRHALVGVLLLPRIRRSGSILVTAR